MEITKKQRRILRKRGTEPPFSGRLLHNKEKGEYSCAYCGNPVFGSDSKFDSGTGWPSFCSARQGSVRLREDMSHRMARKEVTCSRCGSHLGHVFDDGPRPARKRYCINSLALDFRKG